MNWLAEDFEDLKERLKVIGNHLNPRGLNLHFGCPKGAKPWPSLWNKVEELAREGLARVKEHHDYFIEWQAPSRMYDDGMFWYDLFLFICTAGIAQATGAPEDSSVPISTQASILSSLIGISEYTSVLPADIFKRNWEALGNFIYGFPDLYDKACSSANVLQDGLRKDMILIAAETGLGLRRRLSDIE